MKWIPQDCPNRGSVPLPSAILGSHSEVIQFTSNRPQCAAFPMPLVNRADGFCLLLRYGERLPLTLESEGRQAGVCPLFGPLMPEGIAGALRLPPFPTDSPPS